MQALERIDFKTDSNGDTFCNKYQTYIGGTDPLLLLDNIERFEKDYEDCFGSIPNADESKKAVEFVKLFLYNIGYQNSRNNTARCVSDLTYLFQDSVIDTFKEITNLKSS